VHRQGDGVPGRGGRAVRVEAQWEGRSQPLGEAATVPSSSLTSIARTTRSSSAWRVAKRFMSGNSSTHGGQYVPMKLTHTGRPLRFARSMVPPPTCGTTSDGAVSPTWNAAAGPADGPRADADGDASPDADGVGVGEGRSPRDAEGWGGGVGAAPGTGASSRIPPMTSAAAAMPVNRPATMESRGHMLARRVPVRTVPGASGRPTLRFRFPWPARPKRSERACSRRS
jgi:hypothetical protein